MMEGQSPVLWVVLWPLHTSYAVCMPFAGLQQVYECDFQKEGKKKPWSGLEFSTSSRPGRLQCAQPLQSRWTSEVSALCTVAPVQLELLPTVAQLDVTKESSLQIVKWTVRSTQLSVTSHTKELERWSSNSSYGESGRAWVQIPSTFKAWRDLLGLIPMLWDGRFQWEPVSEMCSSGHLWCMCPRHVDGHAAHCTRPRERYWQRSDLHAFLLSSHFSNDWNVKIVTFCAHLLFCAVFLPLFF